MLSSLTVLIIVLLLLLLQQQQQSVLSDVQRQHLAFLEMLTKSNILHTSLQQQLQMQLVMVDPAAAGQTELDADQPGCTDCEGEEEREEGVEGEGVEEEEYPQSWMMETLRCRKGLYWDAPAAYDDEFLQVTTTIITIRATTTITTCSHTLQRCTAISIYIH